jgi:hypothetical protein
MVSPHVFQVREVRHAPLSDQCVRKSLLPQLNAHFHGPVQEVVDTTTALRERKLGARLEICLEMLVPHNVSGAVAVVGLGSLRNSCAKSQAVR